MTDGIAEAAKIAQSRGTRGKFAAMTGAYFAGTLNDNFCRQGIMLLAVAAGMGRMQSYITILFTAPFIFFAAYAGYLSDRFSKRSVVIFVKLTTVGTYILGAIGLYLMSWPIILITVFILGVQATIFSPAIYGSIPELYPSEYVVTANGIFTVISNAAILLGIAGAGVVLDIEGGANVPVSGVYLTAGIFLFIAVVAFVVSIFFPKFPAASPEARFPWEGPVDSVVTLIESRRDALLAKSLFVKAFFWFAGSLQILIINELGINQFGLTKTMTSVLVVIELMGIGVGGLLAPLFARGERWYRVLAPSGILMAVSMFAVTAVEYLPEQIHKAVLIGALALLGIAGGVFSIPVSSFVQVKPAAEVKGKIIASSNFADFLGILLSGVVFYVFNRLDIKPSNGFGIEAIMVLAIAVWLLISLPKGSKNA